MRVARCCEKCSWRSFEDADASCPEHGSRATYTDYNKPYRGREVAQAPGFTQKRYKDGSKARAKALEGR